MSWLTPDVITVLIAALKAVVILLVTVLSAALLTWVERRLLGLWQDRYGPNRVGPFGMFQLGADMLKMFFKEDWLPPFVDKLTFILAPAIAMSALLIAFAVVPITPNWGVADLDIGLLDFPTLDRFIEVLHENRYDIVGVGAIPLNVMKVRKMCELVREHQPWAQIVVGGHVANVPDLAQRIDADHIVRGPTPAPGQVSETTAEGESRDAGKGDEAQYRRESVELSFPVNISQETAALGVRDLPPGIDPDAAHG